ncbi:MAG: OprO/OprP family phosphate-selective porin [Puniceicoccales bacterium]|nr:OprO/OprP family phosphate-selective porin [Puniceicoccales bacterium]
MFFLSAAAAALAATPLSAQDAPASTADSTAALREQIRQLDQNLRILERKLELKEDAAAAAAKKSPVVSIDAKGFVASSGDKAYSLKIGTLLQTDGRFFIDDAAPNRDTLLLRRVRLPINGTFSKIFTFNLTPEFAQTDTAGNNTQLVDAWVNARLSPAFGLKIGKFFGPVALESPNPRHFIESTYTNQLAPNRDIGLEANGVFAEKIIAYRLGLYQGAANNTWAESVNLADGDFTVGGRLTLAPFAAQEDAFPKVQFSAGFSYGHESASNGRIRTNAQQTLLNPGNYSGDHTRVNDAIEFYHGPFSLIAENTLEIWDLDDGSTITGLAWRVSGGIVLTGEKSTNRGVSPAEPFNLEKNHWGALELVARVSGIKVFRPGTDVDAFTYGVGLNWFINNNFQFRLDVEKSEFGSGVALRKDEFAVLTRFQVNF